MCHCEERRDEAIPLLKQGDRHAPSGLAMTRKNYVQKFKKRTIHRPAPA